MILIYDEFQAPLNEHRRAVRWLTTTLLERLRKRMCAASHRFSSLATDQHIPVNRNDSVLHACPLWALPQPHTCSMHVFARYAHHDGQSWWPTFHKCSENWWTHFTRSFRAVSVVFPRRDIVTLIDAVFCIYLAWNVCNYLLPSRLWCASTWIRGRVFDLHSPENKQEWKKNVFIR